MQPSFEAELTRAILISERKRVFIVATFLTCMLCMFITFSATYPVLLDGLFHGQLNRNYVILGLIISASFETTVWVGLGRRIRAGGDIPTALKYAHTLLECTVVTLVFLFEFRIFPPIVALTMPTLLGYFLIIILSTLRMDMGISLFTGAVAGAQYLALALYAIAQPQPPGYEPILSAMMQHGGKSAILLGSGLIAGLVGAETRSQITQLFRTQHDRQRVLDVFGRHVSPSVVNKLLEQTTGLASEVRHVCVMFLDIRNFTTFSEHRTPSEVVTFLNQLFGFMIEEVNRHQGIVNKFLGDGFMAVFGAPLTDGRDCRNAVAASRAILTKLEELVASGAVPPTRIGIGLHAGEAVTGMVGSQQREEYTVIGDVVNLASRIESLNKELASQILISDTVYREVQSDGVTATPRGPMKVKGREVPVEIYQVA